MRTKRVMTVLLVLLGALVLAPRRSEAWNPNTHNYSGDLARADAIDDGRLSINGRTYPVRPEVVAALRDWPQFYHAGVVGPDGFPDITYGQTVIHPVRTGEWLRHVYQRGWAAQSDASYTAVEKSQILAFTYGYLTHAAGDMWAHTVVNDFSDPNHTTGVFPGIGEILTSVDKAGIAVRHLILERYIADATPTIDSNPERGPAPGGDISDDSSPGRPFDAPHRFVYETLVDPNTLTPVPAERGSYRQARGPILGFFLELRDDLQDFVDYDPDPIGDAIDEYNDTVEALMDLQCACNFGDDDAIGCDNACCLVTCNDVCDVAHDLVACPAAALELGITFVGDTFDAFLALVAGETEKAALVVLDAYVGAWIDDINDGLRHWSELGLDLTRGMFDPQARRDLQNDECQFEGGENTILRAECEDGIGTGDVIFHEVDPFINDHLLSMVGLPDFVGDLRSILGDVADALSDVLGYIGIPFNPLQEAIAELEEYVKEVIKDQIKESFGVDIEAIETFVKSPHRFACLDGMPFTLPDPIGAVTLPLFPGGSVDRLDALMGVTGGHVQESGLPLACGRFADETAFVPDEFPPYRNTVTMAKLLLLDGTQMNQMLTDELGRDISTYGSGDDIMIAALDGTTWLRLIDGDHAWRQDGAPVFPTRPEALTAGSGQFPIWESCVQRRAMRSIFTDWENGTDRFPDLGDPVSADPANDPNAPVSTLARAGAFYDDGVHQFVAADNVFTHTAHDGPAGRAFPDLELELQHRFYPNPGPPSAFVTTGQPTSFSLTGADGLYTIDVRSGDRCHTCAEGDGLDPETIQSSVYALDASPPVTTCGTPPFGLVFDTDDFSTVNFTVSDGPLGSGVASQSATIDGHVTEDGVSPTANLATLDMYLLYPGVRTVAVTSADHLGNSGVGTCTFEIRPTMASMLSNLDRALAEGALKNQGTYRALQAMLQAAESARGRGQCKAELNILGAFVNHLEAQRGKGVDAILANRFIANARYVISQGDTGCVPSLQQSLNEEAVK